MDRTGANGITNSVRAALLEGDGQPGYDLPLEPGADAKGRFTWEVSFQHPKLTVRREITTAKSADIAVSNVIRRKVNDRILASKIAKDAMPHAPTYATKVH